MTTSAICSKQHSLRALSSKGWDKSDFLADKRTQQAVILNIVVIGEAATKLSNDHPEFVQGHPEVPWKNMKGMRNRIAHGYFDINLDIVWDTVQTALPPLIERLTAIREELIRAGCGG
jgi:uncharacterized protein with HEPN domain